MSLEYGNAGGTDYSSSKSCSKKWSREFEKDYK